MEVFIYIVTGIVAGTMAGMLGIGGGLIIVPVLFFMLNNQTIETGQIMQIALATSLATIITTSISSVIAHQKHQAINWQTVLFLTPSLLVGAFLCGFLADFINSDYLKMAFALFIFFVSIKMLQVKATTQNNIQSNQGFTLFKASLAGTTIGSLSALVGIGGGTLTVPYLVSYRGFAIPNAIATSATCGLPIAIAGTLGYIVGGWQQLDGAFLGYVYLPAWFTIAIASSVFAPLGAKLTHSLPVETIKKVFALLLIIVGIKMLLPVI